MNISETKNLIIQYTRDTYQLKAAYSKAIKVAFGDVIKASLEELTQEAIDEKSVTKVECLLDLSRHFYYTKYILNCWHLLLTENWHYKQEEIIHHIQGIASATSVPVIEKAIHTNYPILEDKGDIRMFINQCGHALWSINTPESLALVKKLTHSTNPLIKDEMLYRLSRIENRNDYKRNEEL